MRKYASFLTVVAVAAAPFRHRGRDRDYWSVEDPDRLYGPLRAEPFEALGVACKRTAVRLTRATATKEGLADAEDCLIGTRGARETFLRGRKGRAAKNSVLTSGVKQLKC